MDQVGVKPTVCIHSAIGTHVAILVCGAGVAWESLRRQYGNMCAYRGMRVCGGLSNMTPEWCFMALRRLAKI